MKLTIKNLLVTFCGALAAAVVTVKLCNKGYVK